MTPAMAFGVLALAAFGLIWLNATGRGAPPPQASVGPSPSVSRSTSGTSGAGPVGAVGAPSPRIVYVTAPAVSPPAPHPSAPSSPAPRPSASSSTSPVPSASSSSSAPAAVLAAAVALSPSAAVGLGVAVRLVLLGSTLLAVP